MKWCAAQTGMQEEQAVQCCVIVPNLMFQTAGLVKRLADKYCLAVVGGKSGRLPIPLLLLQGHNSCPPVINERSGRFSWQIIARLCLVAAVIVRHLTCFCLLSIMIAHLRMTVLIQLKQ